MIYITFYFHKSAVNKQTLMYMYPKKWHLHRVQLFPPKKKKNCLIQLCRTKIGNYSFIIYPNNIIIINITGIFFTTKGAFKVWTFRAYLWKPEGRAARKSSCYSGNSVLACTLWWAYSNKCAPGNTKGKSSHTSPLLVISY